jgi:hypothetical protein
MTSLDRFESAFNRAAKAKFHYAPERVERVALLTDTDPEAAERERDQLQEFFRALSDTQDSPPEWIQIDGADYTNGPELMERIGQARPDLILTHRLLKERSIDLPYSLGTYLDHLSQATRAPLLVIPRDPRKLDEKSGTEHVMVITSHMTGDERIVNWGASFVLPDGNLYLTHVEDDHVFGRYMDVISKLDSIDTDTARQDVLAQLLKEPTEYIESCREGFAAAGSKVTLHSVVKVGHRVQEYADLVGEHQVDLLVIEGKDESQAAMSGLAYSLAVELRDIPLLVL